MSFVRYFWLALVLDRLWPSYLLFGETRMTNLSEISVRFKTYIKRYTYSLLPTERRLRELGFEISFDVAIMNGQLFVHKNITPWSDIQQQNFKKAIIAHGCAVSGLPESQITYAVLTPPAKQKDVLPVRGYLLWKVKNKIPKSDSRKPE